MTSTARFYCANLGVIGGQSPRNLKNMLSVIDGEPKKHFGNYVLLKNVLLIYIIVESILITF